MELSKKIKQDAQIILQSAPDLYLILSPQAIILEASNSFLKTTMLTREEIIGRKLADVFPDDPTDGVESRIKLFHQSLTRVLKSRTSDAMAIQKYDIQRPDISTGIKEPRYWSPTNYPVLNKDGEIDYIILRIEDVTELVSLQASHDLHMKTIASLQTQGVDIEPEILKRTKGIQELNKKLQESERYNAAFLTAIPDAMILTNKEGVIEFSNNQAEEMFGYAKGEMIGQLVESLMPEGLAKTHSHHREEYLKTPRVRPMGLGMKLQGKRKNGDIFPVEISLSPLKTHKGLAAIAIIRDVTQQMEQKELIEQKEQSLRQLYETVALEKNQLESINQKMFMITQLSETLLACKNIDEILDSFSSFVTSILDFSEGALYFMHQSRNYLEKKIAWGEASDSYMPTFSPDECWGLRRGCIHKVSVLQPGVRCHHIKNTKIEGRETLCIPLMAQNEIFGLLFIYSDTGECTSTEKLKALVPVVAETISLAIANIRLRELLQSQAIRDLLTGLFNRRFLEEYVVKQIGQAKHSQTTISFIMIDVDNFKQVNDQYGHDIGDAVLTMLSKILLSLVREGDLACRYGGEEFLLVLPQCGLTDAKNIAETIRSEVQKSPVALNNNHNHSLAITISLGVSNYPEHGLVIEKLLNLADNALYAAKKKGKNRVVIAAKEPHSSRKKT